MGEIVKNEPPGRPVDPTGNLLIGLDEERGDSSGGGGVANGRQVVGTQPL